MREREITSPVAVVDDGATENATGSGLGIGNEGRRGKLKSDCWERGSTRIFNRSSDPSSSIPITGTGEERGAFCYVIYQVYNVKMPNLGG